MSAIHNNKRASKEPRLGFNLLRLGVTAGLTMITFAQLERANAALDSNAAATSRVCFLQGQERGEITLDRVYTKI
jgi:hypothetical protein